MGTPQLAGCWEELTEQGGSASRPHLCPALLVGLLVPGVDCSVGHRPSMASVRGGSQRPLGSEAGLLV